MLTIEVRDKILQLWWMGHGVFQIASLICGMSDGAGKRIGYRRAKEYVALVISGMGQ